MTDFDVDAGETEVLAACSGVTPAELRRFSYPTILYRDVRSALVHEYHLSEQATHVPMTERDAGVSYANRVGQRLICRMAAVGR